MSEPLDEEMETLLATIHLEAARVVEAGYRGPWNKRLALFQTALILVAGKMAHEGTTEANAVSLVEQLMMQYIEEPKETFRAVISSIVEFGGE
jgi:hypothetical protein